MQTLEFRAMNTSVLLAAEGDEGVDAALQTARTFIEECEKRFSRFLPDSELSRLNRSAGEWFPVSGDLMELLRLSLAYYDETGGLYDPAVLPDLKRAGYDRSMDVIRAEGAANASAYPRVERPAFRAIEIESAEERVRLPDGMQVDLGGIAKGWIVERAAILLSVEAAVCAVSAGGDIFFIGEPADGSKWRVALENPRDPNQVAAKLRVGAGVVATSSIAKRVWSQDGQMRHHIIDPRTGEPAETEWLSATVIAPQMAEAEVYAKVLLIGGEAEASRLASRRPDVAFITVNTEGWLSASRNGLEFLHGNYVHI